MQRLEQLDAGRATEAIQRRRREDGLAGPAAEVAEGLAIALGLDDWLAMGMALAIGGQRVERDAVLEDGVELALLPPVSGG